MTTTNFDSGSLITNDGVTSATYSGWTFGASSVVDFANANSAELTVLLNQSGGRSIISNYNGANVTNFYFKSSDGSDFQLNSFKIDNGPNGASSSLTISGYRDNALIVSAEAVNLTTSDAAGNISYAQQGNAGTEYSGLLTFNSAFNNIDEIRFVFGSAVELTVDDIDISVAVVPPTITSATYNASTNSLVVTATNLAATGGALNDINVSKLTLTGQGGSTYTLTSSNVEIDSATQFTVALNAADQINVEGMLNKNGTSAVDATTFNLAAAADWNPAQTGNADTTGNAVTVSNVQTPTITSATYDASTGSLIVTGTNFVKASGATNDITANKLTFTGEGSTTYTLTDSSNVEITSVTAFTVTLSATDKAAINQIFNKNGTSSTGATTYNLAAADDWNTVIGNTDIADATGNGITVSNVATPTITSATFDASTGTLVVTGTGFLKANGATNDIHASKFTFTGEGGATYTLTDSADVETTSGTTFTITLSSTDKAAVNQMVNKNGTASTGGTTYNLAAAEDWAAGADAAVNVVDATGNGITVSNVAAPTITSATFDASTGTLVVTGTGFLKASGATNDIHASKFTFTGEGGATYTLTDSADVETTSGTTFTITLSSTDKAAVNQIVNKNGTASTGGTTYNLAAAEDWATGADSAVVIADLTGNGMTISNIAVPTMTSATYDYSSNVLTVTGTGFLSKSGASNDIDISKLTITGEGGATYTLITATDVEITSGTAFSVTLAGTDLINVEALLNKNGTSAVSSTTYNFAGAEDWAVGADAAVAVADLTGNAITVSNYAAPAITSATFDGSTNVLTVTGTNLVSNSGAVNDVDVSLLTITGEGGSYTLTSSDVEITSATAFSVTLNAADQLVARGLLNKNGTASSDATTYNIAAAEDWMAGTATSVNIADLTGNGITVSNVPTPTITSATYDSDAGILAVTGTNLFNKIGTSNDIDISTLTLTGGVANATYTITSASDVEITSATSFSVTLSGADKTNVDALLDQTGTTSSGGSTYNLAAADNWLAGADSAANISDTTNAVTVSINPRITSATYNASSGALVVTGTNLQANGGGADIDASLLTFTGESNATYTLTDSADVEIASSTAFTVTLSATDKAAINQIVNKNGTASTGGTTYNLAAADDWNTNATAGDTSDISGNGMTVSNVATPTITSATYNASTGALVVTGAGFLKLSGATNDIDASKLTFTGEGGATHALTDSADVEITSGTAFTVTLSSADKASVNQIINKDGTASTGGTTYNLAAAEDWAAGADAAVNVVDATGNGITASNVAAPTITSATFDASTGALVVTGTGFLKASGATNDIDVSKFTFTGEGGATYTLTDSADVEVTSGTAFTLTLSATDKTAVNLLLNKTGTTSTDATTYNLAAAEDWTTGADAAVNVADLTGNGITVTVPAPSSGSGGNGNSTTTTTIDGAETTITTQPNGTVITTLLPITPTREDDPASLLRNYADIPLVTGTSGNTLLTISLPVGVGMNVQGLPREMNLTDARDDLIQRIAQGTGTNSTDEGIINQVENFLSTLDSETTIGIRTVTPTVSNNQVPELPIIITGTENTDGSRQALIIDASNLPPGSIIQLANVAFAYIVGAISVTGGAGENYVVGDDHDQYIVLGADNDILFGGGGDDTIGSLGGDDQASGEAGNDIVFGGTGNDRLSGGNGNDQLNGGLGFDIAAQEGQLSDYRIEIDNDQVMLIHTSNGETDTLIDIELIQFATGNTVAIAYSEIEAVAHHLAKTWLGRDLTVAESNAVQNWQNATTDDILTAFHNLPEAVDFQDKTDTELLNGLETHPDIIQLDVSRNFTGGDENNQGYLPLGLAVNADGGAGHDVLQLPGTRDGVHLEFADDRLELTQLSDGAMFRLRNAEMIAFDNGETVVIAHDATEGILGRLFQSFFDRNATIAEWQLGREALQAQISPDTILDWFQQRAGLDALSDTEYVQTIYSRTLERSATDDELSLQMSRLANNEVERKWLAVEIAQSNEATISLVGSVMLQEA